MARSAVTVSTALVVATVAMFMAGATAAKGPCSEYFGPISTQGLITVADPDVFDGFPFGNQTFVHHSGPGSVCKPPGPPVGCHRYYVATYSDACTSSCPLVTGAAKSLAGNMDTTGAFDRASGVLKGCFDCLKSVEIHCWAAPADEPVSCVCPGAAA